ncbi:MAG: hypothetical protein P1U67_04185 [Alcanivoracaceae bacterium]|nr:hypothetical protein [Alcanivoracaceae bacterium]
MSFQAVPLLIFALCAVLVITGVFVLIRQQWLVQWLKGTAGLLFIAVAIYFSLFALNLFSYQQLTREAPVATVSFKEVSPQVFSATVSQPNGTVSEYELNGELWQLDARIIKWKGLFALFGFAPGYQLDRISGRYLSLEDELSRERTVYEVKTPAIGFDIWQSAKSGWSMMVDASYGSATYLPMTNGAIFEVTLSNTGLVGRPLNGSAQEAVERWD